MGTLSKLSKAIAVVLPLALGACAADDGRFGPDDDDTPGDDDLTSDNVMMGTAKYLSPEQVRGRRLDGRADLYSLALVLYECLAGRVPFLGETDADTALARLQRSGHSPIAPARAGVWRMVTASTSSSAVIDANSSGLPANTSGFPAHAETPEFEGGSGVSGRRVRARGKPSEECSSIEFSACSY